MPGKFDTDIVYVYIIIKSKHFFNTAYNYENANPLDTQTLKYAGKINYNILRKKKWAVQKDVHTL